jgi:hypothetical protein
MSDPKVTPSEDLQRIIDSARRLGVEMDEEEAMQWLTAIATTQEGSDVVIDTQAGVYGHRISMLDFSPGELAHFRRIGALVGFPDTPGRVETALALSGSAAQSKIQSFPGDADFFERVNIIAATREEACQILAEVIRAKAMETLKGPDYQLIEVKFGNYPMDGLRGTRQVKKGNPVSWSAGEIMASKLLDFNLPDGTPITLNWSDVQNEPGWCKLDWVVADNQNKNLVNASNMLDVTWEGPDGSIVPLDGYMDPYFQEVYLEAESIPVFSKLAKHVASDALDDYVTALEHEVKKYLTKDLNYGKVAKRMYNIFRLTGRYEEAAFLRELFDEPTTILYQVWSLIRTIDDCFKPGSTISVDVMLAQTDDLVLTIVRMMEGEKEVEVVRFLLRLKDILAKEQPGQELSPQAEAARAEVINIVNNFFLEKLNGVPTIKEYMDTITHK